MFPYMYETQFLVEEGATPEQVDRALTDFGMAMGMFAVDDMAGLDVGVARAQGARPLQRPARAPAAGRTIGWSTMGRLGQKTRQGLVSLRRAAQADAGSRGRGAHPVAGATAPGIAARTISDEEIVERAIYALVNEGARALEDGVAARASDIDVIYVNGYGFPAWRGGPMFYADRVGLGDVLARIRAFHREHGARWTPAPLLVRAGRARRHVPRRRVAWRERGEEPLTCRPPSRDACARRGCCRRTRSSAATIAAGCASARRTPLGPYPATADRASGAVGRARARPHVPRRAAPPTALANA